MQTALTNVLNAARAAILARAANVQVLPSADTRGNLPNDLAAAQAAVKARAAAVRPVEAPAPRVRVSKPPAPIVTPSRSNGEALEALGDLSAVKAGPRRLLALLHSLAGHVIGAKGYAARPSQVTFHQSQELLSKALGVTTKTIQRWTRELEGLGHLATRAHYGGSKQDARIDGLVVAVSLKAGHKARLHHEDMAHQWRDLEADRKAGRTAWAAQKWMSESLQREQTEWIKLLQNWSLRGSFTKPPLEADSDIGPNTVQDVIYTLPLLADLPPRDQPALVSACAAALAHDLNDEHSRRFYARVIWDALEAERSGVAALQPLAALLTRLEADMREWAGLRRPAALLASRLKRGQRL